MNIDCPICNSQTTSHDVVDFNKACIEFERKYLPLSGKAYYYNICKNCQFCFCPELYTWTKQEFEEKIYNQDYITVDPEYKEIRPKNNALSIANLLKDEKHLMHLDYGGGNGYLSNFLKTKGYNSISYDPFVDKNLDVSTLGKFDLITSYEVFEHVPDVQSLMNDLTNLIKSDGIILFSTLISDGNIIQNNRLTWWYAAPRNGHISLYSKKSLQIIAEQYNLKFDSFSPGMHIFYKTIPNWAKQLEQMFLKSLSF